jgi:hypothetical protein
MTFFKFTTDKTVRRLRWVMVSTMLFDIFLTLLGQPSSYWLHPDTLSERNPQTHHYLAQGLSVYVTYEVILILVLLLLASTLPRKLALVLIFYKSFAHYFGSCTWLDYHWHFGDNICSIYGIILGLVIVQLVFSTPTKATQEDLLVNEPDA